jgi:hypothetical protein
MRNFLITALTLLAIACLITVPAHAAEETAQGDETVTEVQQEVTEETPTETIFEGTEAVDTEAVTEAITEQEEITTAIDADDALEAEDARQWLIDAIKNAKPEQVEFIKGYIEDALVAMEGLQYTEWEWIYKITSDNAEWVACIIVGLGFIFSGVVMIVKYRREKVLINNSVDAVGVSERKMDEMVKRVGDYEMRFEDLAKENGAVIKRLDERDKQLADALQTICKMQEQTAAATKHDIDAMLILADVLDELIQLSNIPQVKKDAIYSKHETAKNHIVSEMEKEKEHEENEN